jgi:hypothetical protein
MVQIWVNVPSIAPLLHSINMHNAKNIKLKEHVCSRKKSVSSAAGFPIRVAHGSVVIKGRVRWKCDFYDLRPEEKGQKLDEF